MKKKKSIFGNLVVLTITITILFLIAEATTRMHYVKTGKVIASSNEEKCNKQLYKQVSNQSTINRFNPGFTSYYEYSNYSGIQPKANINFNDFFRVNEEGHGINFVFAAEKTNAQHIRALKDFDYEKNSSFMRIAILGDSFTWGADAPFKYTYSSILEEIIPNSEVLNFGIEGVGIDSMYLRWKYDVLKFNPDVVVFAIYIDDIRRAQPCMHKPKLIKKIDKLGITNFPPPSYEEILKSYKESNTISYFLKHLIYTINSVGGGRREYKHGLDILELELKDVNAQSQKYNTYFMVLLIEAGNDYVNNEVEIFYINKTKELVKKMQIPYATSKEIFNKEKFTPTDNSLGKNIGHFTPEGYGLLAQGIKNKLEEEGIIPKQKDFYFNWRQIDSALFLINKKNKSDVRKIIPYTYTNDTYVEIKRKYLTERTNVNGKLAYIANKNGKGFIVYNDKEIGKEYDTVKFITEFNSKLLYIAEKNGTSFVVYDGQEIGKES